MKEKKTEILTIRMTERLKKNLEEEADSRGWSPSKLAEQILNEYLSEDETIIREIEEENEAKKILDYIEQTKCNSLIKLTEWIINNNLLESYRKDIKIWETVINEIREDKT